MKVFVSEYISSGAMSNRPLPESLLREGLAMVWAIVDDLLGISDCRVVTTLDCRLTQSIDHRLESVFVESVDDELVAFDRFARTAEFSLVIAPETDGILTNRVRRIQALAGRPANCSPEAIELCGDKLRLARHLQSHGLRTIETEVANLGSDDPWDQFDGPCVLKPHDGAGSWLTFLLPNGDTAGWRKAVNEFREAGRTEHALVQPYIPGTPVSVACLCHADETVEVFPVGRQHFKVGTFQYLGGSIPASLGSESVANIASLVRMACAAIPGLRGYIGFDLILPSDDPLSPVITEINPRLTTSYVGYRQLCRGNIAERWLKLEAEINADSTGLMWNSGSIRFGADGSWERHKDALSL